MKRLGRILATIIFTPIIAVAGELPSGCYVTFSNPNVCYSTASYPITWTSDSSVAGFDLLVQKHGVVTGSVLHSFNICKDDITFYKDSVTEYSSLLNQGIDGLNRANKINQSLRVKIKKLQKACGSRCQNIR